MNCLTLFSEQYQANILGYEGKYPLLHGVKIELPPGTDVFVEAMNGSNCLVRTILPEGNPTLRAWIAQDRLYGFDPAVFAPPAPIQAEPEPVIEVTEDATDATETDTDEE